MKFTDAARNNDLGQLMRRASQRPHLLNVTDDEGKTALMISLKHGHDEMFAWLAKREGVDVDAQDPAGETALFMACHMHSDLAYADCLLEAGADASIPNNHGVTCLMAAASKNHHAIVACLLREEGPLLDAQDDHGWTALHRAAEKDEDGRMTWRLLRAGCSPLLRDEERQLPVDVAHHLGRPAAIVNMLEV